MAERATAEQQLERLLHLLPSAARGEWTPLAELAEQLEVSPRQLLRDLEEVTAREFYHPAGQGADLQILLESERVCVWTKGEFRRPVRLLPREALALGLGLRALATELEGERREEMLALAARLEKELSSAKPEELLSRLALESGEAAGEGIRLLLLQATRERRRARIRYLKSGTRRPDERSVRPYALVFASQRWYLLAHCERSAEVRAFRLDRVLEATLTEESFAPPADFDPQRHLRGGRVYRAEGEIEVVVRYTPRIARWVREQGPVEERPDGSVVLRHRVADPRWAVRHVLQFGGDAEVLAPPEIREMVRASAERNCTLTP